MSKLIWLTRKGGKTATAAGPAALAIDIESIIYINENRGSCTICVRAVNALDDGSIVNSKLWWVTDTFAEIRAKIEDAQGSIKIVSGEAKDIAGAVTGRFTQSWPSTAFYDVFRQPTFKQDSLKEKAKPDLEQQ